MAARRDFNDDLHNNLLNDFFTDNYNLRLHKKKQKSRHQVLESLVSSDMNSLTSSMTSLARKSGRSSFDQPLSDNLKSKLKPLPVNDYHRVSNLMHRISAVSGSIPTGSTRPTDPTESTLYMPTSAYSNASNVEIASRMAEHQFKAISESTALKTTMDKVIKLHHELDSIAQQLQHRVELAKAVEDVNNRYIVLFEEALGEVMRTQKVKFKSQTSQIEHMKVETQELRDKIRADRQTMSHQREGIEELQSQLAEAKGMAESSSANNALMLLERAQRDREAFDLSSSFSLFKNKTTVDLATVAQRCQAEMDRKINAALIKNAEERAKMAHKLGKSQAAGEKLAQELAALTEKAKVLDNLSSSVTLRRPLRDNECQTEVTVEGIWDKKDGWTMPISKTALIRARWRRGMRFAACPACRGVGQYVHQVGEVLRAIQRGSEPAGGLTRRGSCLRDSGGLEGLRGAGSGGLGAGGADLGRWSLPDQLVRFMGNLPKTILAFRPRPLAWAVRCCYLLLALKRAVDLQDDALGYAQQPLVDFVIERYLMHADSRAEAELRLYHLLQSVHEHRSHPLLQLFVRFLGALDQISRADEASLRAQEVRGEDALRRKRDAENRELGARSRSKLANTQEATQKVLMLEFPLTQRSLSLDVLGVYAVPLAKIKARSVLQQAKGGHLRGGAKV
ncbi:hypothetical protein B484DRAFT_403258 [Ochromonadaceae sp. CCMP2298]|nr:hypothetical protein B484DRAFT_403258 [Ochromonadaceae sp. CCMP2298]